MCAQMLLKENVSYFLNTALFTLKHAIQLVAEFEHDAHGQKTS